jgi:hypothetical protein
MGLICKKKITSPQLLGAKKCFVSSLSPCKAKFLFDCSILISILYLIKILVRALIKLNYSESIYEGDFILLNYTLFSKMSFVIVVFLLIISIIFNKYSHDFVESKLQVWLSITIGSVLLLNTVLMPTNWYFNSFFFIDRILLLLLFIFSVHKNSFFILWVFHSIIFIKQLQFPNIFNYTFTDKEVFYESLIIIGIWPFIKKIFSLHDYYLLLSVWSLFSSWYFLAGFGKLEDHWWNDNISNLFLSSLHYSWLSNLKFLHNSMYNIINNSNYLLISLTLVVELGVVLLFLSRRLAFILLPALFLMHLCIFLFSGIFFWKWMVFISSLFLLLISNLDKNIFSAKSVFFNIFSIFIIGFGTNSVKLSWLDAGIVNYHIVEFCNQKKTLRLDASYFSPYDVIFAQNRFYFLEDKPVLSNTYGCISDPYIASLITNEDRISNLQVIIDKYGLNSYSVDKSQKFDSFIRKFVKNKTDNKCFDLCITAPKHIYQGNNQTHFKSDIVFEKIKLTFVELKTIDVYRSDTLNLRYRYIDIK